jgi:hypothetical protein
MREQGHWIVAGDIFLDLLLLVGVLHRWIVSGGVGLCLLDAEQSQVQGLLLLPLLGDMGREHLDLVC